MKSRHHLIGSVLAAVWVCSLPITAWTQESPSARASEASTKGLPAWVPGTAELDRLRASLDVPGLTLVALSECQPTAPVNIGFASLNPPFAVTHNTVFEAASLSKPVFAYLVLQLVDEGVIDLDRPVAEDFFYPRIMNQAFFRQITPRMILSHRTGLPNWVGNTNDADREDVIDFTTAPGRGYSYSGEAYELLRAYIEFLTGETLDQLFSARLGDIMPMSGFGLSLPAEASLARGYFGTGTPDDSRDARSLGGAAGGLLTTSADYARFIGRLCKAQGLSDAIYADMLRPVTQVTTGDYPGPAAFGLGWVVTRMGPETVVLHGGDNDEFRSLAVFLPDSGDGVVILTNGRNGGALIDAIVERMQ